MLSKQNRQIDILISEKIASFPIRIIIDCKYFSKKIDVKIVESFIGMLADLKASKGIIITNVGFTKAALLRAKYDPQDIDVSILDFEDLESFSGIEDAIAYRFDTNEVTNQLGVIFSCPFGWKIHKTPEAGIPAGLTIEKCTWEQGIYSREVIYLSFSNKNDFPNIEDLLKFHEIESSKNFPGVVFTRINDIDTQFKNVFSEKTILRFGNYPQYKEIECSIYIDFGTFYAFFVLTSPKNKLEQNLKKLAFIARTCIPLDLPKKTNELPLEYMKLFFMPRNKNV